MSFLSDEWMIKNGVRQGGVLSGLLFSLYINSLLNRIEKCKYGCKMGILKANVIAYADDLVLLAPSAFGLQVLINEAVDEAFCLNLKFNKGKSKWMIFRVKRETQDNVTDMKIEKESIERVYSFKYLGFIIRSDLVNADDIQRALKKFYIEFNSILRKFSSSDTKVKLFLFKSYCLQIYGADLWLNSKGSVNTLNQFSVAYHKAIKKILGLSTRESNHFACQEAQMFTFDNFLNRLRVISVIRFFKSPCAFIAKNLSFLRISSSFYEAVNEIFSSTYDITDILDNDLDAINSRIVFVQNREDTMR